MSNAVPRRRGLPPGKKMRHTAHFVDELEPRANVIIDPDSIVGRKVSLSMLEPDPKQPRTNMGDLAELVASIREKGVLEPILVRRVGEGGSGEGRANDGGPARALPSRAGESSVSYRIISGERRYRAAQEAGLSQVPVIEMDVDEQEALEIALIENLQRKDLTAFEEAEGYAALGEQYGYTHEQVAHAVSKSRTVVTESLTLLQIPKRVREIADGLGVRSKSVLLEVCKAESEDEMVYLLEAVASQGLSRDDLRRRFRQDRTKRGGRRKKPYVFKFRAPDKRYSLSLSFRQSTVEKHDLIEALEQILVDLRQSKD